MPQNAAGWRIDPPVSVPSARGARPAATAAADPPDEPPGTRDSSQGFLVGPYALFSVDEPIAYSSILVLPKRIAPAALSLADHGGVVRRPESAEHPAAAGRRLALDANHILDGDRNTGQAAELFAGSAPDIDRLGLRQGVLRIQMNEHVEPLEAPSSLE